MEGLPAIVIKPNEHLRDQLGGAVCARVNNATRLADLQLMLVKKLDVIPQYV